MYDVAWCNEPANGWEKMHATKATWYPKARFVLMPSEVPQAWASIVSFGPQILPFLAGPHLHARLAASSLATHMDISEGSRLELEKEPGGYAIALAPP